MPYQVVTAGTDFNLLKLLDAALDVYVVVAGDATARSIYGIYKSQRIAHRHAQRSPGTNALVYGLFAGTIFLVTLL